MRSRMIAVMLIVSVTICTAWAQDEERVLLRYQWNAGEEIVWDVVTETSGTMVMRDLTKDPVEETMLPIWSRVMMPMTLTVESVDDDGNGTVVYELGTMQMDVQAEGRQVYMEFDPATGAMTMDGQQMPVPGGMQAGMAGPYRMVISPRGEVLDIELPEGLAMMGLAGGADMTQWMKMSQQWSATFPEEPVYADYVWSTQFDAPLGTPAEEVAEGDAGDEPAGDGAMVYCMTGTRLVGGVDCVTLDAMGAFDIETLPMTMGGVFAFMGGEGFESSLGPMHLSMIGGFDFDAAAGRMMSGDVRVMIDMTQRMKGTIQTPDGAQQINMEIITRGMTVDSTIEVR